MENEIKIKSESNMIEGSNLFVNSNNLEFEPIV
jgi:hypothetical protein